MRLIGFLVGGGLATALLVLIAMPVLAPLGTIMTPMAQTKVPTAQAATADEVKTAVMTGIIVSDGVEIVASEHSIVPTIAVRLENGEVITFELNKASPEYKLNRGEKVRVKTTTNDATFFVRHELIPMK